MFDNDINQCNVYDIALIDIVLLTLILCKKYAFYFCISKFCL